MASEESAFKSLPKGDTLESLRSPEVPDFASKGPERESVVTDSDFNDIALDDEAVFSPVSLTRGPSPDAATPSEVETPDTARPPNVSSPQSAIFNPTKLGHKKTASTTTIRSANNLPFIVARLGIQDEERTSHRGSVDGQQKLQEEFARLHKEEEKEPKENGASGMIDWDFWGAVISDYQGFASERPEELATAIARGIPDTLRGMMWQHMAASKDLELEDTYLKLLRETSPHEKAITRDLGRTFPHHDFFNDGQGIGQENLFNVLKAYSLYDPQVGYCQGLPFVVAILLLNMPDEEAFSLLVRLMYVYDLRGHFLPEMPKLQLRLFQFDRLIEELLPVLHVHFLRQGIKSSMFCSQWFLTMFSYRFPLPVVFRIYDNCLASGIEAIFGFSIMLLKKNEEELLALKFDEILSFLNTRLFDKYKMKSDDENDENVTYNVDEFVQDAIALHITPFMLDSYRHEYEDQLRETNKHATEMDELRTTNRNLSAQVKKLENSLAQLNAEHVDLLNELVKSRLRNEEMEEELVRYKLLYAEAMHENEDAQSSHRISIAQMLKLKRGSNSSTS
ncbi:putative rab-GTPase-TBC domain containing protein [Lyophyllum shimeji]|uniref:Rab-GTPase-TBC domain containing protein n=1 Tax=Lyophyllum shimeji TaxID=47721 RepID=A0A9P3PLA9_LYOSH|nr:putative rab-GTPase-TBC domain containing protein [Lyophyllum shimeji]